MKGRQRTCPILGDHVESSRGGSIRGESDQLESQDDADTHCVLGDLLDGVSGRIMVPSLFSRVVGGRGLSRNVPFARCFPSQDVGECTETDVQGPMPRRWSVRNMPLTTVPLSTSWLRSSEGYKRDRRRIKLTPAPTWVVTGDVAAVGEFDNTDVVCRM